MSDIIKSYSFTAEEEGPSVLVLGAIHGNEKCGSIAADKIIKAFESGNIKLKKGHVTFVPICNPKAYQENIRFCDVNLNRVIKQHDNPKAYEEGLANQVATLIEQHDFALDLHSIHSKGSAFVFVDEVDEYTNGVAAVLDVDTIIYGWSDMYEETEDCTTSEYAHKVGKSSVTVECGSHDDPESINIAEHSIYATLQFFGLLDVDVQSGAKAMAVNAKERIVKEAEGSLGNVQHMSAFKAGETIATYDNGHAIIAPMDCVILIPFEHAGIGEEWFYIAEKIA